MSLTPEELETARTLRLQGKSTDDVYNYIAGKRVNAPSRLSTVRKESLVPSSTGTSVLGDVPQDIFTGVKQLGEGYQDRFSRLKESGSALVRGEQGIAETGIQFGANIAGGVIADPLYQLARTGASFATTPEQETKIAERVGQTVQDVGAKTGITNWYSTLDDRSKRNINAALDIADVLPAGLFGKAKSLFGKVTGSAPESKLIDAFNKADQGDISDATRIANATLDEATREAEVSKLARGYQDSLVGDRVKVNRLLQEQATDMSRGGIVLTQDDLIKSLANEGIIPDIRGKLADFTTEIRNLDARQNKLFEAYQPVLEKAKATAPINDFSTYALRSMADSPNLRFEINKAEAQLDTIIDNLRKSYGIDEGGVLTAKQIDDISRQANARTKAYRQTDTFQADVYSELGRAARSWLKENIPDASFQKVNEEWLRLENIKRTAETMQNQQIDVGILGRALGSYVTTLTGVTLGASLGNPITSVAAGILTKMGGDAFADALRSQKFSPEIRAKLQERLTNDKALIENLKQTATTQENKNLLDAVSRMLPAPKEGAPRSSVVSGAPIAVTPTGVGTKAGDVAEYARGGAVKQPAGDRTPTVMEEVLRAEDEARQEALTATQASIEQSLMTIAQTQDGGYVKTSSFPSWLPKDKELRSKDMMEKVYKHLEAETVPDPVKSPNQYRLYEHMKAYYEMIRFDKLNRANSTNISPNDMPFSILFATGAGLAAYYTMGEDGSMIPLMGAALMAKPVRRATIQSLDDFIEAETRVMKSTKLSPDIKAKAKNAVTSAKRERDALKIGITPEQKRAVAQALEEYDESPIIMSTRSNAVEGGMNRTLDLGSDTNARLSELKDMNASGKFTDADAIEARKLLQEVGEMDAVQGAIPDKLIQEAKKYKSAEEFVKAQNGGTKSYAEVMGVSPEKEVTVYRGLPKSGGDTLRISDWVGTDHQTAALFAKEKRVYGESGSKIIMQKVRADEIFLDKDAYPGDTSEFRFYPKSQLTDIWNKANGK